MQILRFLRFPVLAALATPSLPLGQSVIYTQAGGGKGDQFGVSVDAVGDWNGDGFQDLVVGASQSLHFPGQPATGPGYAQVISGATGTVLDTFSGLEDDDWFGSAVAGVGDVNADGVPDVAVGAVDPGFPGVPPVVPSSFPGPGYVRVLSGADGAVLYTLLGDADFDYYGQDVAGVGDVDGDGFPDLAASALGLGALSIQGWVRVHRGPDGGELFTLNGTGSGNVLGHGVDGAGDWDGDGLADLVVLVTGSPTCLLYTSPSPRDQRGSRMPSSA